MSDEKRMRELFDRLVAMSPEPPPFPEETIVTRPASTRRTSPVLIFAGAAAVVLLLAVIPLLLGRGEGGPATTPSTGPTSTLGTTPSSTVPETTTPTETTTSTTTTSLVEYETTVYLVQRPENSFTGNPALVAFLTTVQAPEGEDITGMGVALGTLELLTNPDLGLPAPGFFDSVPDDVVFESVSLDGDVLTVAVNEAFRAGAGGLLDDMTMLNQLVYLATQSTGAQGVLFQIDGRPIQDFGTDGLDISDPLTRETFLESVNAINITHPIVFGGDEVPAVSGIARVFEAVVSLEVVETAGGEVVHTDFTTATEGAPGWGEFTFLLDIPGLHSGQLVRVFESSAEDGGPTNVVTIPVGPDGPWDLTP